MPAVASTDSSKLWRERVDQEGDKHAIGTIATNDARYGVALGRKPHANLEVAAYAVELEFSDKRAREKCEVDARFVG